MEVICIKDFTVFKEAGDEHFIKDIRQDVPKKGEIYNAIALVETSKGFFFILKEFDEDRLFFYKNFANIDNLSEEINDALLAENPNIKKYALDELKQIGYKITDSIHLTDSLNYLIGGNI